jgi:hypothetical protein
MGTKATAKKTNGSVEWRVTREGVGFAVKRGGTYAMTPDGKKRTLRTRDAAVRVARQLNAST